MRLLVVAKNKNHEQSESLALWDWWKYKLEYYAATKNNRMSELKKIFG